MAIAVSIALSLIVGIGVMFNTKYFWGKESNPNINNLNCTITNMTNQFGTFSVTGVIILIVVALAAILILSCSRGF